MLRPAMAAHPGKQRITMNKMPLAVAAIVLTVSSLTFANETIVDVESRGVSQRFSLITPDSRPVAAVLLYAGGHGGLKIGGADNSVRFGWGRNNNLVRTRQMFASHGFLVATVDNPSDRRNKINAIWRMGENHAADMRAVVDYVKARADVPVWVIGTSMGSFSAANAGISLGDRVAGVVLTSSITRSPGNWKIHGSHPNGVVNMDLAAVRVPVMVVSHQDDGCDKTPAADIHMLAAAFSASPKVEKQVFTGGTTPTSKPCQAMSRHGFIGIEQQVVDAVAAFIKAN